MLYGILFCRVKEEGGLQQTQIVVCNFPFLLCLSLLTNLNTECSWSYDDVLYCYFLLFKNTSSWFLLVSRLKHFEKERKFKYNVFKWVLGHSILILGHNETEVKQNRFCIPLLYLSPPGYNICPIYICIL